MVARKKKVVRKYKPRKVARGRLKAKAKSAVISRKPRRKVAARRKTPLKGQARKPAKLPRSLDSAYGRVGAVGTGMFTMRLSARLNTKLGRTNARKMLARAEDFIKYFEG